MNLLKKIENSLKCFKSNFISKEKAFQEETTGFEGVYFNQIDRENMRLDSESHSTLKLDDSINDI